MEGIIPDTVPDLDASSGICENAFDEEISPFRPDSVPKHSSKETDHHPRNGFTQKMIILE